jgi:hypothetical protein
MTLFSTTSEVKRRARYDRVVPIGDVVLARMPDGKQLMKFYYGDGTTITEWLNCWPFVEKLVALKPTVSGLDITYYRVTP